MPNNQPILITGAARSGTSLTAGVIQRCGAFGGSVGGPTRHNKKGMYENASIRNQLVKPYLDRNGWDRLGQNPLPDIHKVHEHASNEKFIEGWREEVLDSLGHSSGIWYYKGAKMCLMWPVWHVAFPEARWVIVRRETRDVVNSCLKTSFMRKCGGIPGWRRWVGTHLKRFKEMQRAGLNIRVVWPQEMISGDFTQIKDTIRWLGLRWNAYPVVDFVTPALWSQARRN